MALTIKDIARLAGVSPTAVSFVLNEKAAGNVSPKNQQVIKNLIRQYAYKQDRTAKALIMGRSFRIAICYQNAPDAYPWLGNASHHLLINNIASRLHQTDYSIDLIEASPQSSLNAHGTRLLAHHADGFFFINYAVAALEKIAFLLIHHGLPVVSVGTPVPTGDIDWVAADRQISFEYLVNHALEQGITRLGFLDTDISKTYSAMKQGVFERIMHARQLDASAIQIINAFGVKAAARAVQQMITSFPDLQGIVLTDNGLAPHIQLILSDRQIQLFGFGDDIFVAQCEPQIPYMQLPMRQMAKLAVEHLLRKIERPDESAGLKTLVPCNFIGALNIRNR